MQLSPCTQWDAMSATMLYQVMWGARTVQFTKLMDWEEDDLRTD